MNKIYRLFLTFNSTYLIIVVYLIKAKYRFNFLQSFPKYYSWILFILLPILFTSLSFLLVRFLSDDNLSKENIVEIELANNNFLPSYLGYFFVSVSIIDLETLCCVYTIIYVFTFLSQTLYFNPIFLLFGYHFYFVKNTDNVKIFLITKKRLKKPNEFDFGNLKRINDYTFIDTSK